MSESRSRVPRILRAALVLALAGTGAAACAPPADMDTVRDAEASSPPAEPGDLDAFVASLPHVDVPTLDRETALALAAMPLSCLDHPHAPPRDRRGYLDNSVTTRVPGYESNRSFYGCWDWHSAVNSTWAMVRLYKEFPDLRVAGLMQEKLDDHLSAAALAGEMDFFEDERSFERPYGWAWLIKLHAELSDWDHEDADEWAARVAPLARLFSERMVDWLKELRQPSRVGVHANTAFALAMMLDAARSTGDLALEQAVTSAARRLYGEDFGCPTAYEPWGSDFLSPCLEEAALMAAVLDQDAYLTWLADFLPPITSREFEPLTRPTDPEEVVAVESVRTDPTTEPTDEPEEDEEDPRQAAERRFLASKSHLIGLAFIRADALNRIVDALPEDDPRIPAYRAIARVHGAQGFEAMFDASYAGSHWIGTFALKYLLSERAETAAEEG